MTLAMVAWASAAEPGLDRLFPPQAPSATSAPVQAPSGAASWPWLFLGAAMATGALWVRARRAKAAPPADEELRVLGVATLAPGNALAVVEAKDAAGTWTRWLVASGATPALIADLGRPEPAPSFEAAFQVTPEPLTPVAPTARVEEARALVAEMAAAARRDARPPISSSRPAAAARYRVLA